MKTNLPSRISTININGSTTKSIIVAVIISLPGFLAWITSVKNSAAIQEVHVSINSRMDELLKASKAESKAEGVEQGRADKL